MLNTNQDENLLPNLRLAYLEEANYFKSSKEYIKSLQKLDEYIERDVLLNLFRPGLLIGLVKKAEKYLFFPLRAVFKPPKEELIKTFDIIQDGYAAHPFDYQLRNLIIDPRKTELLSSSSLSDILCLIIDQKLNEIENLKINQKVCAIEFKELDMAENFRSMGQNPKDLLAMRLQGLFYYQILKD